MNTEPDYCVCGHTIHWHIALGVPSICGHSTCECVEFERKYTRSPIPIDSEPTTILLKIPEGAILGENGMVEIQMFFQMQLNRRYVGGLRYGAPRRRAQYMTRMKMELEAYKKTGNHECLLNIANYAFLESFQPQNNKYNFDPTAESVTREKLGV